MKKFFGITLLSLPAQTLIGAICGVLIGLFFGDYASELRPIGTIYIMLLQAVVYPYVISTLISGLGKLTRADAWRLLKSSWGIYLFLIAIVFGVMIILGNSIPFELTSIKVGPSHGSLVHKDIFSLLIPQNLFDSLAHNYVPAVVIFCILFGISLQMVDIKKEYFFNVLDIISKTCLVFWNGVVKLAPIGTFALLADTTGTLRQEQLTDLGEYLTVFFLGTFLLIFWILPAVISSLTGIRSKHLLSEARTALIISFATTLSVVALPYIFKLTKKLLQEKGIPEDSGIANVINTILVVSYPLGQLGNFFVYLFILFAALYFNHSLTHIENIQLPIISYFSSLGSPTTVLTSIQFISRWLGLPDDTLRLFVEMLPLTRYNQVLVSVMGFIFLSLLITFKDLGILKISYTRLILHLGSAIIVLVLFSQIFRAFIPNPEIKMYERLNSFSIGSALTKNVKVTFGTVDESKLVRVKNPIDSLFRIQQTGVLRVGYNADMRPFVFFNNKNELVGLDISFMYALAQALNCNLQFIPFTWQHLVDDMLADKFDIAVGGIYVTQERLQQVAFTEPYHRGAMTMIIPKGQEKKFKDAASIRSLYNLKIGVFDDPILIPFIQNNFPNASIVILPSLSTDVPAQAFAQGRITAVLWSQAQSQIWVLGHPNYTFVELSGVAAPFLMAFMTNQNSPQFLKFLNYWMELKTNDGFKRSMVNKWILIRPVERFQPRWSVIRSIFPGLS